MPKKRPIDKLRDSALEITEAGEGPAFEPGQRVFHKKFGYGKVLATDGNKLEIEFEKAGTKMVLDSFVEAA